MGEGHSFGCQRFRVYAWKEQIHRKKGWHREELKQIHVRELQLRGNQGGVCLLLHRKHHEEILEKIISEAVCYASCELFWYCLNYSDFLIDFCVYFTTINNCCNFISYYKKYIRNKYFLTMYFTTCANTCVRIIYHILWWFSHMYLFIIVQIHGSELSIIYYDDSVTFMC